MLTLASILEFLASLFDSATAEEITTALNEHVTAATAEMEPGEATAALEALSAEITDATNAVLDGDRTSDQALANLAAYGAIFAAVGTVATAIESDVTEREARAAELAAQILGNGETPDGEDGDDPVEGDDPAEGDPVESEPIEGDEPVEPETAPAEGAAAPEPVAAAGQPRTEPTRALRPSARRPRGQMPVTAAAQPGALPDDIAAWGLTAGANVEGMTHGQQVRTADQLASVFVAALRAGAGYQGGRINVPLMSLGGSPEAVGYGEDRILRDGDLRGNMRKITAAAGQHQIMRAGGHQALAASGGICAPLPVTYDEPMIGSDARPVRDRMLTRFGAERGGVNLFPALFFEDMEDATGFWTNANDIAPGTDGPAVKPCLTMTCPDDEAFFVYAVTQCLEVGVFRSRFFSEQVEAWIRGAAIANARAAEIRLLSSVATASTQVTAGENLGTIPSVLAALDHACAVIRSSNRLDRTYPMQWGVPFWLIDNMRTDMARRLPTGTTDEQFALTEAQITRWLSAREVTPIYLLDGESGQMFPRQGDGPVQGYPSTVVSYLYPAGSHLFLDGGELNIGIVRDSALIETNDYRIFSETFEGHAFHGVESWRYTMDICPDGSTSAAIDISPCTTGS